MTNEVQDFRAQNLDFLRWRYGTHKHLQKKLAPILNWTELSNFALGQKRLPDYKARRIEEELKLPSRWLDRDNVGLTAMETDDFALVQKLLAVNPNLRAAIGVILDAVHS